MSTASAGVSGNAVDLDLVEGSPSVLREIWDARDLLYRFAARDVRVRYKQAVMGFAWALLMPVLIVMAGVIVQFAMAQVAGTRLDLRDFGGITVKAVPWAFFVGAVGTATNSLTTNITLVTKIYFPREVLPLAAVGAQAFDSTLGAIPVIIALPFLGGRLSTSVLWAPVLAILLVSLTTGICLFLSCANLFFRDVKYIVQVVLMFGIFVTPVFFEPAMLGPRAARLAMLNPLAPLLEGLRLALLVGHNLWQPLTVAQRGTVVVAWSPWWLAYSGVWAIGGLALATAMFHRLQYLFAEYV
jgi:lipopolysaccharide transport system permease protein